MSDDLAGGLYQVYMTERAVFFAAGSKNTG